MDPETSAHAAKTPTAHASMPVTPEGRKGDNPAGHQLNLDPVIHPIAGVLSRDLKHINDDVKVSFLDVFAEPDDIHSFDAIWTTSESVFTMSRLWCYRILSAICAIPCAIFWGINFSCLAFCTIWDATPLIRSYRVILRPCAALWKLCLLSFCDPCYESCGKLFSNVTVSVLNKTKSPK
ncbi:caveolin-3-like [Liolophura sinensis]|uniref:caveolin-3-like n=1 Tax=Liolophura sinensis TaxID=3198878 RepID=UPI003158D404